MIIKLIAILAASLGYYLLAIRRDVIAARSKETKEDRDEWHSLEFYTLVIYALIVSYLYVGISFTSLFVIGQIATLRIVVFNPGVSLGMGNTFFHIGQGKWEKNFEGKEKLYYFTNVALFILCLVLTISGIS
jgi:Na+/H+ antiporter NhaC